MKWAQMDSICTAGTRKSAELNIPPLLFQELVKDTTLNIIHFYCSSLHATVRKIEWNLCFSRYLEKMINTTNCYRFFEFFNWNILDTEVILIMRSFTLECTWKQGLLERFSSLELLDLKEREETSLDGGRKSNCLQVFLKKSPYRFTFSKAMQSMYFLTHTENFQTHKKTNLPRKIILANRMTHFSLIIFKQYFLNWLKKKKKNSSYSLPTTRKSAWSENNFYFTILINR